MCCVDVSESQDVTTEEEQIEVETGAAASSVVQLENIPEVKDIVESSKGEGRSVSSFLELQLMAGMWSLSWSH